MAAQVKNYFLAPSWDYAPKGPIALGNIIMAPNRPVPPLHASQKLAPEMRVVPSYKTGVEWTQEHKRAGSVGIYAKFLQMLGVGVDLGTDYSRSHEAVYKFERIETEEIFPDDEFVRQSVVAPGVARFLERNLLQRSVYMIVGVKTVTGAAVKSTTSNELGVSLDIGVDGTLTGAPLTLGPRIEISSSTSSTSSFASSSDFVFAFRVRKVRIRSNQQVVQDDYNRGALFGLDEEDQPAPFEVLGLEDCDAEENDRGGAFVIDDGEYVRVFPSGSD